MISVQTSPFLHPACVCTLYQTPDTTITRLSRGPLEQNYLPQHMQIMTIIEVECRLLFTASQASNNHNTHIILSLAEGMNGGGGGWGVGERSTGSKTLQKLTSCISILPIVSMVGKKSPDLSTCDDLFLPVDRC